jgi:hypothetical protein
MSESQKETYKKWKELVNMSASELKRFMDSEEGKKAGLSRKEAKELGIHYGRESARWILKMKNTPVSEWTPKMWEWANRQISFNSRMRGNKGKLYDDKGRKTRKHLSLLIWGHNPEKYEDGGKIEFQSKSEKYFEYVPISEIEKYKEFDRATEKKWGSVDNTLDELINDIKENGIQTPITLQVDLDNNALIVEGNTRLAAAKHLGLKYIPVRIVNGNFGSINKNKTKKIRKRDIGEMKVFYANVHLLNYDNSPARFGFNSLIKMEKGGQVLLAPNGKPSNLTPEQYKLVRSDAFISWFGDWLNSPETASKVVDENGEPLVCYHSTSADFNVFNKEWDVGGGDYEIGIHFGTKKQAEDRAKVFGSTRIINAFLKITNLIRIYDQEDWYEDNWNVVFDTLGIHTPRNINHNDVFDIFKKNKLDGFVYKNDWEDKESKSDSFVLFNPSNIKLADGTNTTFDANNPDIRFDDGGKVETDVNLFAPIPILKKDRFDEIYKTNIESLNIDEISEKAFLGNIEASNGDVLDLYGQEINVSSNYSKKFIRKITAINEKSEVILAFWEKNNDVIINFLSSSSSPYSHKLQIKQKRGKPTHKKQKLGYGSDLVKILSTQAKKLGKEKIIADDVIAFKSEKYWEKLGFVQENDDIGNRVLYLKNYNNNFELGGEITLTSEQVENKLGRELHWWNDDVVSINGIEYKKVFLKDEYKKI